MARRIIGTLPGSETKTTPAKGGGNTFVDMLPLLLGIGGGVAGTVVPGLGNIVGSGLGAAAGETLKQRIKKTGNPFLPPKEGQLEDLPGVLREGITGAIGAKVGNVAGAVGGKVLGKAKSIMGKSGERIADKLAATVGKASPAMYQKANDVGVNINKVIRSWLPKLGKDYDEILGVTGKGEGKGTLGLAINKAEKVIQNAAKSAGTTVRISGDALLKNIRAEAKLIKAELASSGNRTESIDAIAKQAEKVYKNGLSIPKAVIKLRSANQQFGKNIFSDAADAVDTAVQKMEANIIRSSLRKMFPTMAKALDQQQELIILREALKSGRAKIGARGFSLSAKELAQEVIDPAAMKAVAAMGGETAEDAGVKALGAAVPGIKGLLTKETLGQGTAQMGQAVAFPEDQPTTTPDMPSELQGVLSGADTQESAPVEKSITPEMVTKAYALLGEEKGDLLKKMYEAQGMGEDSKTKSEPQVAREASLKMAQDLFAKLQEKGVKTGPAMLLETPKSFFNKADPESLEFNTALSALKAAIAKARAGTSFTPNEEKLLDRYTPNVGDSYQNLYTKLKILASF